MHDKLNKFVRKQSKTFRILKTIVGIALVIVSQSQIICCASDSTKTSTPTPNTTTTTNPNGTAKVSQEATRRISGLSLPRNLLRANQAINFRPHRFTSKNNITILHEVHEPAPILISTHEVLPLRPARRRPYTVIDKPLIRNFERPRPLREYELHPVTFDFNLGDLEDLEHESLKKGDLSSEERHLLRNENDDGLTYNEAPTQANEADTAAVDVEISELTDNSHALLMPINASSTAISTTSTTSTSTTSTTTSSTTASPPTMSVGTHILKILKNKQSKKGRELSKSDEHESKSLGSTFNSISHYFGTDVAHNPNATAESLYAAANYFQILTNLYDHFYWQIADIRTKVRTACGLEMQAYLTALHGNYDWAQSAYDVSGRYRGQLLFGNDKWLGQMNFCYELNNQDPNKERKHFELQFYVANIMLNLQLPKKLQLVLNIGECLPKSCSSQDVHAVLSLDPHARMLTTLNEANVTHGQPAALQIMRVRVVPGLYSNWRELKFQIFISFILTLILLVMVATCYQMRLNERYLTVAAVPAISAKVDARIATHINGDHETYYGKPFELFQMRPLSDNANLQAISNELVSATIAETDVNGNKGVTATNIEMEKSELADCKVETGSCTGATGTYEAKQQIGLHEQILLCFAFQTNAKAILSVDQSKETFTSCLHGLRVISVLWTMMVHTYLQMFAIGENKRIVVERSAWFQVIGNATFSVDTFFFISGLLVTLLYLKQDRKYPSETRPFLRRSCVDTFVMFFYRYIRLTPAYLFVVMLYDFVVRHGQNSSVFQPTKVENNSCRHYWWRNILYINNYYPQSEICMMWSWYMANDMQFYIMAVLLLALSRKYFKFVVLTLITFLLSSWAISGVVSLHYHYTHKVSLPFESFDYLYDKPWQRVGAYIIGMCAGYVLYNVKTPPKISRRNNLLLWSGSLGLLLIIIFGVWDGELNELYTAFYVGIGHSAFGCGLVWVVLSCCWGYAPAVNRFLSYRGLIPLSRLTYCAYLVHPICMFICSSRMSGTVHLTNLLVLTMFLGNAVVSFSVAFLISVLLEAPVIRLLKMYFKK